MTQYLDAMPDRFRPESITVVIPTIRPRRQMLARALDSVAAQSVRDAVDLVIGVAEDTEHAGAAKTRQKALEHVATPWVAFLDDDDEMMPRHLERLLTHAIYTGADYVYSWFTIKDAAGTEQPSWDPFPDNFGKPFDPLAPIQTTITTLVRTELAQAVGFDTVPDGEVGSDGHRRGEDHRFTLGCLAAGGSVVHLPEKTWWWWHHGANTSGMPDRWH
jgi:hypothetical protein